MCFLPLLKIIPAGLTIWPVWEVPGGPELHKSSAQPYAGAATVPDAAVRDAVANKRDSLSWADRKTEGINPPIKQRAPARRRGSAVKLGTLYPYLYHACPSSVLCRSIFIFSYWILSKKKRKISFFSVKREVEIQHAQLHLVS